MRPAYCLALMFAAAVGCTATIPSEPPIIRGIIPTDGSPGRTDLSLGEQLRQRAAMGGEQERAALKAFEEMWAKLIADALVAQLREEAAAHGVDVVTWLARTTGKQE